MRRVTIRSRILATSLLPVALVVAGLVGYFAFSRLGDMREAHTQWSKLLVNRLAQASEYGVFSGNRASLQRICESTLSEPGVQAVAIFDSEGVLLTRVGVPVVASYAELMHRGGVFSSQEGNRDIWILPIESSTVELYDLFAAPSQSAPPVPKVLGHVVIEISRDRLHARESAVLYVSLAVGLLGLLLGGLLAARLGSLVMRPITRLSNRIQRIGKGDFAIDTHLDHNDPLYQVQSDLNSMAIQLAWGRDELEQRVADVTDALRLKKEEAESATLAKSRFLSAASHDLRQPVHALGLFVARLGQLPMDPQVRTVVANIEDSVQAMQDLLDGLLDLSRLESGVEAINPGAVSVGAL
ncbi:MAG: hybrid sensor histidine kinase/response regulator, partial [Burkholderiaceae bacterium]|nr:hybrid sensor histidine kinase/response regulator [Burkholderiaceae bacterium]